MSVTIRDQVAVVVGASSGIGRETAVLLAREGARVMASARREHRLKELKDSLAAEGHPVDIFPADASQAAAMVELTNETRKRLGEIDIVVYATGINTPDRALTRLTTPIWDEMININLNGAFYITEAVLPAMRQRRSGHLIYVSSISGQAPDVSGAAYQASKRGMLGLAHAVRMEERENGIRTCVVCPGLVDSELLRYRPAKPTPELLAKALQPADVAEVILAVAKLPPHACVPELAVVPTRI